MERLTCTSPLGNRVSKGACAGVQCDFCCDACGINKIISKLWEYEETGLSPDGIKGILLDIAAATVEKIITIEGTTLRRLAELVQADKAGRVLHYAPGDTVYDCFDMAWTVTSSEIHKFGDGPLRYLYRCGHPGTDDYCALYSEEIQTKPEAGL